MTFKKKIVTCMASAMAMAVLLAGCGNSNNEQTATSEPQVTEAAEDKAEETAAPTTETAAEDEIQNKDASTMSLKEAYKDLFDIGVAVNSWQLADKKVLARITKDYSTFTCENEMKPDYLLDHNASMEAKDGMPVLTTEKLDEILTMAEDAGLKMRGHTLVWHSQTPEWLFREGYDDGKDYVDKDTMLKRMESYIKKVITYCQEKHPGVVYAWDVVNEYLHRGRAWSLNWTSVYGDMKGTPSYVKRAFERAYEMLEKYDATDKVTLFYNDYDTYFEVEDLLALVNFINEGEKAKICSGIGMQSHVDVKRPTIEEYGAALEKFMAAGYEVQITELDFTINFDTDGTDKKDPSYDYKNEGETIEEQAAFVKDFMEMVIAKQKNRDKTVSPKGITGLTIWGLYDSISWRGKSQPLLFGTSIDDPKPAFQAFLEASRTK